MAGSDEKLGIRAHEGNGHGHLHPIGKREIRAIPEFFDQAEHVVPSSCIEPAAVITELVENLVHLESRRQSLDQDGGADRSMRNFQRSLRGGEHVVPQPGLEVALHLGKIKVRPGFSLLQFSRVVKKIEPEIEDAR